MVYIKCPTCNKSIGTRIIYFNEELDKIYSNKTLSNEEKINKHEELVRSLLLNPCCNQRIITSLDKAKLLVT